MMPKQTIKLLDYKQEKASNSIVPNPAILASNDWKDLHLEFHQQPEFETVEHQHTMHVIACGVGDPVAEGERSLDGKIRQERRNRGDIAIIPAGIAHLCNWNTTGKFGILAIEPRLLQQVGQGLVDCDRLTLIPQLMNRGDILIEGIFSALREELQTNQMGGSLLVDSLKTTLAIHLLRKYCSTKPKLSSYEDGLSSLKLKEIREYIDANLDRNLKIVELAKIAQISPYYFIRLFRKSLGKTPYQYILQRRIEKGKYLLQHSQLSAEEIAASLGFCDRSHFAKYIKRSTGLTPKQLQTRSQ
ncbi:MAG: AraC family transcriptional regulator [Cyanobacteria bacterium P01_G01_bin.19]